MHKDDVIISEPCHANWDTMSGDERKRFCGACNKHVHDLSALTERRAKQLVTNAGTSDDGVCVRYTVDEKGAIRHRPSRRMMLAAAALAVVGVSVPQVGAAADTPQAGVVEKAKERLKQWWTSTEAPSIMGQMVAPEVQVQGEVARVEPPKPAQGTIPEVPSHSLTPSTIIPEVSQGTIPEVNLGAEPVRAQPEPPKRPTVIMGGIKSISPNPTTPVAPKAVAPKEPVVPAPAHQPTEVSCEG